MVLLCDFLGAFCRAINYDEKDPFLCNACGFCKYAKFDFTLTAKPCCAVDPIENEEDRKKVFRQHTENTIPVHTGCYKMVLISLPIFYVKYLYFPFSFRPLEPSMHCWKRLTEYTEISSSTDLSWKSC